MKFKSCSTENEPGSIWDFKPLIEFAERLGTEGADLLLMVEIGRGEVGDRRWFMLLKCPVARQNFAAQPGHSKCNKCGLIIGVFHIRLFAKSVLFVKLDEFNSESSSTATFIKSTLSHSKRIFHRIQLDKVLINIDGTIV